MVTILQHNPCIVRSGYGHKEYVLYTTTVQLRGDGSYRAEDVYFFSTPARIKETKNYKRYKPCALPGDRIIKCNKKGMPYLDNKEEGVKE